MRLLRTIVCLGILLPAPLHAQDSVRVAAGSSLVDGSTLLAGVDTFQLLVRQPDGGERSISRLIRSVERTGTGHWRIVQRYTSDGGENVDTSVVRAGDLAPVSYVAVLQDAEQRFQFDGTVVQGTVSPKDSASRDVHFTFDVPVFNSVVDEEVIRALPLTPGLVAIIEGYNPPWPPAPRPTVIRVTGTTTVQTAAGLVDAWEISYAGGGAPTTLWLSRRDGRLLRLRSVLRQGAVFWKIPVRDLDAWRAGQ